MSITQKTKLAKIMELPKGEEVLAKNGVPCVSCPMAKFELDKLEIGDVCQMYGLDLEKILKDLNNEKKDSKN